MFAARSIASTGQRRARRIPCRSRARPPSPPPCAVPAGTTAAGALEAAGVALDGPSGAVVVRERATGELRDLGWAPEADVEVEPVAMDSDGRPCRAAALRPRTCSRRPSRTSSRAPGWASARRSRTASTTTSCPSARSPRRTCPGIEKRMQEIVKAAQRFSRRPVGDDEARAELAHEPFKLELIDLKGAAGDAAEGASAEVGAGQLTMYDNLDRRSGERVWTDLCRGPHLPTTRRIPAVQAHPLGGGVLAGQREATRSCSGSTAPPGSRKDALAEHLRLLAEAEKRDHRRLGAELDLFSLPGRDRLRPRRSSTPRAGSSGASWRNYSRHRHERGGLRVRQHPAHHQGRPLPHLGAPAELRGHHVPADHLRGRELLPQADELPVPHPDLPRPAGGPTGSCRCGCSSSAPSTGTRSPASCTA